MESSLPKVLLLISPPIFRRFESEFSRHFHFVKAYESSLPLPEFLATVDAASISAMLGTARGPPITASGVLDHLPSLRCIVSPATGVEYIDLDECRRRGIAVANSSNMSSSVTAELAVGLLIDVLRNIAAGDRFVRAGHWSSAGDYRLGYRLRGKRIGIVGLGSIGSLVAKRLEAFGCIIAYNSRQKKSSVTYPFHSDINQLAVNSDVLVICCALTDQTRHIINKQVLVSLGKQGVVVNVARGGLIDEQELVRCLEQGEIAGAGLDVFEDEPNVPKELLGLDNVVVSPHLAGFTEESFRELFELVKGNLLAFFTNKPLLSPVL